MSDRSIPGRGGGRVRRYAQQAPESASAPDAAIRTMIPDSQLRLPIVHGQGATRGPRASPRCSRCWHSRRQGRPGEVDQALVEVALAGDILRSRHRQTANRTTRLLSLPGAGRQRSCGGVHARRFRVSPRLRPAGDARRRHRARMLDLPCFVVISAFFRIAGLLAGPYQHGSARRCRGRDVGPVRVLTRKRSRRFAHSGRPQ